MTGRPCGLRGTVKRPSMSNCEPVCANAPAASSARNRAARLVGEDGILRPRVPQLPHGVHELLGARVPLVTREEAAPAEVLPREGVPARHDVPARASAREVVEARELPGQFVRLVEGRVQRADETDVLRDGGQRGEHRKGVGPAGDVVLEHAAGPLAQSQSFGEEEVVEAAALGGLGDLAERVEGDLTARVGVLPGRVLVDAADVRGEDDLLARSRAHRLLLGGSAGERRRVAVGNGRGKAQQTAQRCGVAVGEQLSTPQLGHELVGDARQVVGDDTRTQTHARVAELTERGDLIGQRRGRAGEDPRVRHQQASEPVEPLQPGSGGLVAVEEHHDVGVDAQRLAVASDGGLGRAHIRQDSARLGEALGRDEDQIGGCRGEAVRHLRVRERGDDRLALRRTAA